MNSNEAIPFRLECPDCDVTKEAHNYDAANEFARKHQQHTSHEMDWVRANFDTDLGVKSAWELSCDVCQTVWTFDTREAAHNHQDEHAEYTDHKITNEPEQITTNKFDIDRLSPHSLKELISDIEEEYDEGAPEMAVVAVMSDSGQTEKEVRSMIEKLRTKGEVYEPKRGHLRTT